MSPLELLSRIWGGNLHLGLFEDPREPLLEAQLRARRRMAKAARLRRGQAVLEAACGLGSTARYLAEMHGVRVCATDIAEAQLAEARELTKGAGLSDLVSFRHGDFHELPVPDASFDVWWCQEALLYSIDKRRVLEEAIRVVRPGGRLILSDLLLVDSIAGEERHAFAAKLQAPDIWSIEQWDKLLSELPIGVVERRDWAAHTEPTFRRALARFREIQAAFTARLGPEVMDAVLERLTTQHEMAEAGELGWCFYALQR
jgi:sarcosine/dimethylglycine N-methyltransferase